MKGSGFRLDRAVISVASTHFLVDGFGNVYAPLLPLLIPRLDLSLAAAGVLATCFQIASSVAQLGFGQLADRWRPRVLLLTGPFVAVVVLSLVGLATTPFMLAVILMIGGLGGAAFHPPAAALVHRRARDNPGFAMSVHITGGSLGFSLGPLVFAPLAGGYGLQWTPLVAIPAVAALLYLLRDVPQIEAPHRGDRGAGFSALRPYALPLSMLYLIVVLRTLTSLSFATFVPVMLTRQGMTLAQAGVVSTIYLFATGIGGFLGGPMADRFGARRVIVASLVLAVPFLVLAPFTSGWIFTLLISTGGLLLQSTLPVNVTFGQALAPVSAATVSSLMMGFAWGTGGLSVPFVGMLADSIGIERALTVMAFMPIAAALCAWPLPARAPRVLPQPSEVGISEPHRIEDPPGR
jgi:FSR family fosmidomycin resistance protein-like MFS transporter